MKEIKFRAWDNHSEKMLEIIQINFRDKYLDYSDLNSENGMRRLLLKEVELMQFTNTYDDDKTEIYEGDIMLCDTEDGPCLYQIKFGTTSNDNILTSFYFDFIRLLDCYVDISNPDENDGNEKDIELYTKYNPNGENFIVIGNIYKNPELLEMVE